MSTNDWTELERLWQSDVPAAAPALEVIAWQQKRAWAWRLTWISEVLVTVLGVAASIWAMMSSKPYALTIGLGTLALSKYDGTVNLNAGALAFLDDGDGTGSLQTINLGATIIPSGPVSLTIGRVGGSRFPLFTTASNKVMTLASFSTSGRTTRERLP